MRSEDLNAGLMEALKRKGYSNPTPIQRKVIPVVLSGSDVIAMARTGSGKTLAFSVPMLERMREHSNKGGLRALVLAPTRELCMQTYRYLKGLSEGSGLRVGLLTGGDALEHHFEVLSANPDVVVASPGRLLHILHETGMSLSRLEMLVFDEADRLLEMGFQTEIEAIVRETPSSRQTLLFSATLPKVLAEFTKIGLRNPEMIRLDTDSQLSDLLYVAHLTVRSFEKTPALLLLLHQLLRNPDLATFLHKESGKKTATQQVDVSSEPTDAFKGVSESKKSAKKAAKDAPESKKSPKISESVKPSSKPPPKKQCIIFASSRHHVEYLSEVLTLHNFQVSSIYGQMDASARKINLDKFEKKRCEILIVTDVAARGIDIPQLDYVINYDFPDKPKLFVHRVGRTARAGRSGSAFSLLTPDEFPYLLDILLFLNSSNISTTIAPWGANNVHGRFPNSLLSQELENLQKLHKDHFLLDKLQLSMQNAFKLYRQTRKTPSRASVIRAKDMTDENGEMKRELHPFFKLVSEASASASASGHATAYSSINHDDIDLDEAQSSIQAKLKAFRPALNIFEVRHPKSNKENPKSEMMTKRRKELSHFIQKTRDEKLKRMADLNFEGGGDDGTFEDEDETQGEEYQVISHDEEPYGATPSRRLKSSSRMDVESEEDKQSSNEDLSAEEDSQRQSSRSSRPSSSRPSSKKRSRDLSLDGPNDNDDDDDDDDEVMKAPTPKKRKEKHGPSKKPIVTSWKDDSYFLSGTSSSSATDKGLAIKEAPSTIEDMILDLAPDDDRSIFRKKSVMTWDKKKKKYIQHQDTDAGKKEMKVRNESGQLVIVGDKNRGKLYKEWSDKTHKAIPKAGEDTTDVSGAMPTHSFYRHAKHMAPSSSTQYAKGRHGGPKAPPKQEIKSKEELRKSKAETAKRLSLQHKGGSKRGGGGSGNRSGGSGNRSGGAARGGGGGRGGFSKRGGKR